MKIVGIKNLMINVRVEVQWSELSNFLREDSGGGFDEMRKVNYLYTRILSCEYKRYLCTKIPHGKYTLHYKK
jgi:hypothetical protein